MELGFGDEGRSQSSASFSSSGLDLPSCYVAMFVFGIESSEVPGQGHLKACHTCATQEGPPGDF